MPLLLSTMTLKLEKCAHKVWEKCWHSLRNVLAGKRRLECQSSYVHANTTNSHSIFLQKQCTHYNCSEPTHYNCSEPTHYILKILIYQGFLFLYLIPPWKDNSLNCSTLRALNPRSKHTLIVCDTQYWYFTSHWVLLHFIYFLIRYSFSSSPYSSLLISNLQTQMAYHLT